MSAPPTVTNAPTPPLTPDDGDLWFNVLTGRTYVWYIGPSGVGTWVETQPTGGALVTARSVPGIAPQPPTATPRDVIRTPEITVSPVPPVAPLVGDLWWSPITGMECVWYDDGNSTQWVQTQPVKYINLATLAGPAGGDLTGMYPNPQIIPGVVLTQPRLDAPPDPTLDDEHIVSAAWVNDRLGTGLSGYLPLTGGTMTGDLLVNSPAGAQVHLGNAWIDLMATTGGPGIDWQTFSAPANQQNWQMYPDSGTGNALLLAAASDTWTNLSTWAFHRDGTTSFPNKVGIGTTGPLTFLDVHANVNGAVSMGWFVNDSTGASSRSTIVQEAGGRAVFRNVDRSGQYFHEVGQTIPIRYSDFDTHYFRNTAGVAQLTIAPTGVTLASALLGTTALFSGTITSTAAPGGVRVDGPVATNRTMGASTSGLLRWTWGANNAAESGSNAGSDFTLNTYSDAGAYASTPLIVNRATGAAVFAATVQATRVGVGMVPSATATSTVWSTGDITLNGANHAFMGNLYYDSGWKYTAGGATAAAIKLGIDTTTAYQLLVAPNNAGAAGAAATPVVAMTVDGTGAVTFPVVPHVVTGTVAATPAVDAFRMDVANPSGNTGNIFRLRAGAAGTTDQFKVDMTGDGAFSGSVQAFALSAPPAGGNAAFGYFLGNFTGGNIGLYYGTGVPTLSTFGKFGSLYMNAATPGLPYYNNNGTTGWDRLVGETATQTLSNKTITGYTPTSGLPTSLPPSGVAGGDLAGTYPNPTIKPSVTNGQVLTTVGGVAAWAPASGGGASISVGDTPPGSPTAGALWWNSTLGAMFIYYNDGNSSQWVPAAPSAATATSGVMRLYDEQVLTVAANQLRANIPLNAKAVELWFGITANVAANEVLNLFGLNGAALITTLIYNLQGINSTTTSVAGVNVSGQPAWGIASGNHHVGCIRFNNFASATMAGNADFFTLDTSSIMTKRQSALATSSAFNPTGFAFAFNSNNNMLPGSYMRTVVLT